jgi:hypothetical protein
MAGPSFFPPIIAEKEIEMGSGENRRLDIECVRGFAEHELRTFTEP